MKRPFRRAVPTLALLCSFVLSGLIACGPRVPESIQFQSVLPTLDGLRQVENETAAAVFVRPGVRMADFDELIVDPFMISYTNPKGAPKAPVRTLDRETEERLTDVLQEAFIKKMKFSRGFTLVEAPGPRAVRVQGWLFDLVVEEPPTDDPRNFPLCFAEVTVILTVRHSETAQALARVAERTRLSCSAKEHARFYTARWPDIKKGVTPWASFLRGWLEDLHALPPLTD